MAKNITKDQKQQIIDMYKSGMSQRDIKSATGHAISTVAHHTKGMRSYAEARLLVKNQGKRNITENTRLKLSEAGKKSVISQKNRKFWTKPEQKFCSLIRSIGIGVKFPKEIKDLICEKDDENAKVSFQHTIQRYTCDFVNENEMIVFRIHGDFWHANPKIYNENSLTKIQKFNKTRDQNCKIFLESRGYLVIDVWEYDINHNEDIVKSTIIGASKRTASSQAITQLESGFESQDAHLR